MEIAGKYGLVTGGGSGIGAAVAELLASSGAGVFVTGRTKERLDAVCGRIRSCGGSAGFFPCDLTDPAGVDALVEAAVSDTGRLDFVVNNAGVYFKSALEETQEEQWDATFDTNVKAIFLLVRRALSCMGEGSAIVNIGSTLAAQTSPGTAAYAASKAAVVSLTRSLARELAPRGIRVNCINPGIVDTPVHDPYLEGAEGRKRFLEEVGRIVPLGRIGSPEDVALAVRFLISDEAAWITGAVLPVDGGISLA